MKESLRILLEAYSRQLKALEKAEKEAVYAKDAYDRALAVLELEKATLQDLYDGINELGGADGTI